MLNSPSQRPVCQRLTGALLGLLLFWSAALAARAAAFHAALGVICGEGIPAVHCGLCYGAVVLGAAGLSALAWAVTDTSSIGFAEARR